MCVCGLRVRRLIKFVCLVEFFLPKGFLLKCFLALLLLGNFSFYVNFTVYCLGLFLVSKLSLFIFIDLFVPTFSVFYHIAAFLFCIASGIIMGLNF